MKILINKLIKLIIILKSRFFLSALSKGTAAGIEHLKILRTLDLDHIIDIGANKGQFALVCRKEFPYARIDSFEPLKSAADIFQKVFKNDGNTYLHRIAIGKVESNNILYISNKDDSSSLLPIGQHQQLLFPGTQEREQRKVNTKPLHKIFLDKDIQDSAMLKIDVQGYELEVLHGCKQILERFKYIYCECSFVELYDGQALAHEVLDFLNQHSFKLSGIFHTYYDKSGIAVQADFLFSNYSK
ncbi:MAG: FkbM family methyltransferase [Bacteroidota bacterium]|nr:FkbM family methyltransferase [Bacteroidota bacterium]